MANGYQQFFQHPLTMLGAGMMRGADPRGEGLGGLGYGLLNTGQVMREQAQLEEENARARRLADLQAQTLQAKLAAPPKLGQTPLYFRDKEGNLRIGRFGPKGVEFPETPGLTPVKPVQTLGIGGQELILPYGAEQPTGVIQRTLPPQAEPATRAAQTAATERARATVAATEELPLVEESTKRTIGYIDELIKHPGLEAGTGLSAMFPVVPGSDRADFEARKEQLVGSAFLQAYQELKGGGQITEIEGKKAEASLARMSAPTSKEDFIEALEDFRSVVEAGRKRARKRAGDQGGGNVVEWSEL